MYFMLPPSSLCPSSVPVRPFPASAWKFSTSLVEIFRCAISNNTAFASGCSLFFSSAPASSSNVFSSYPGSHTRSVTRGSPLVMVPVLSSATICTLPASSSETAVLKRIPFFAPIPLPTMIATGVASPSAHGQLMTSTDIPLASA